MARSGCIYGPSGSRKTTAVKHLSHYIAQKTGKATLLLSADGGGWSPCEPEVQAGMIIPYRIDTATFPMPLMNAFSRGYWPKDLQATEAAKINMVPIDWTKIGGIAVEGWTSISQVIMRYLPDKGISVGGEDRSKLGGFTQPLMMDGKLEQMHFRSNTRGDYGFIQAQLYGLVMNFNSLPCEYVMYTALESKTEDDDRSTIYGPSISGKKATNLAPSWVGDLLHAQDYTIKREVDDVDIATGKKTQSTLLETEVRFFYAKHPDPTTGIPFPAKPRVTPEKIAELYKEFPGGYFVPSPTEGFDKYLDVCDRLATEQAQSDTLKGWREKMDEKLRGKPASTSPTVTAATK
jgi:hypothetical protein